MLYKYPWKYHFEVYVNFYINGSPGALNKQRGYVENWAIF